MTRDEARTAALNFINRAGCDCVGVIETESQLAAALIYEDLRKEGLLTATQTTVGPLYSLTPAGLAALRVQ